MDKKLCYIKMTTFNYREKLKKKIYKIGTILYWTKT